MAAPYLRFDRGPLRTPASFSGASQIIRADTPDQVAGAFAQMQEAHAAGLWLAGFGSYELGYALTPKLAPCLPEDRKVPLLWFGTFDAPQTPQDLPQSSVAPPSFTPVWDETAYSQAFHRIHDHIRAGDIYQANLTFPMHAQATCAADDLFAALHHAQPVPHGAFVQFDDLAIISRSPELFFARSAEGALRARPMKGTAPRGQTAPLDAALSHGLRASIKNRAENLMIVDLLRNDLSRVSEVGSVKVPQLFEVERYATLHQMTSEIVAQSLPDVSLLDLFVALFPCGSVTGAPKIRAMEILRKVEAAPREVYCGSLGWIAPDGAMEFNVAIRTLLQEADGALTLNVGGGVVYDSTAQDEYREALLKAQFITHALYRN